MESKEKTVWGVEERGSRAVLWVCRPEDGRGLYRAAALGRGGRFNLGTLAPGRERGMLELRRVLEKGNLAAAGAWPVTGVETHLSFPFRSAAPSTGEGWQRAAALGERFPQRSYFHGLPAGLCRREAGGWAAEFPVSRAGFPIPELFCFARRVRREGGDRWRFQFDGTGWPVMPGGEETSS